MSTETKTFDEEFLTDLAAHPHTFDDLLADRYRAWEQAGRQHEGAGDRIHSVAEDRREGRQRLWRRTMGEVMQTARIMAAAGESRHGIDPAQALAYYETTGSEVAAALLAVTQMEDIYRRPGNRWQRFFPCGNRDGHIHASYRDCPTVRWSTPMAWRPDLSGLTVDEAVEKLGPALCSVCFPAAPVEQRSMTLGQVADERTRAEREAARAARQAVKDAKQLRMIEQFRDTSGWVTTVAGALKVLRDEVEYRDYYGHGEHPSHAETLAASVRARAVLLAREAEHPGWGADQAAIGRTIASAVKKNIRDGARLDPATGASLAPAKEN